MSHLNKTPLLALCALFCAASIAASGGISGRHNHWHNPSRGSWSQKSPEGRYYTPRRHSGGYYHHGVTWYQNARNSDGSDTLMNRHQAVKERLRSADGSGKETLVRCTAVCSYDADYSGNSNLTKPLYAYGSSYGGAYWAESIARDKFDDDCRQTMQDAHAVDYKVTQVDCQVQNQ